MLFIFDLDDTLIQTTKLLAPLRLERALYKMQEKGFFIENPKALIDEMWVHNEVATGTEAVLRKALAPFPIEEGYLQVGIRELTETKWENTIEMPKEERVIAILEGLAKKHTLAVVTRGVKGVQEEKMELFGIPFHLFAEVVVVEKGGKKPHYERLATELNVPKEKIVVIGDRIEADLRGAKELGFYTIHVNQGRGKILGGDTSLIDAQVEDFEGASCILKQFEEKEREYDNK